MKILPKKCIAINALFVLSLLFIGTSACAAPVIGNIANLSGHLLSKNIDGTVKILSQKSAVEQGDTLVTEKDTYARIKFIDNSEITLRPDTQFKIENFSYDAEKPSGDNIVFDLVKGGLRAITGLLGKRNHDRFSLKTPSATIGIRGTIFIAEYVPDEQPAVAAYGRATLAALDMANMPAQTTMTDAPRGIAPIEILPFKKLQSQRLAQATLPSMSPPMPILAPGLYVHVIDGMINLSNKGGAQNFSAGQFGFTASIIQPPVIVPNNPGLHFTPPPAFNSSSAPSPSNTTNKSNTVDCEVR
jgi:hypothetical protein